jgi:hypothetical protein
VQEPNGFSDAYPSEIAARSRTLAALAGARISAADACDLQDRRRYRDPEAFARAWHILMKGAIVAAMEGDHEAAQRAKSLARLHLAQVATAEAV